MKKIGLALSSLVFALSAFSLQPNAKINLRCTMNNVTSANQAISRFELSFNKPYEQRPMPITITLSDGGNTSSEGMLFSEMVETTSKRYYQLAMRIKNPKNPARHYQFNLTTDPNMWRAQGSAHIIGTNKHADFTCVNAALSTESIIRNAGNREIKNSDTEIALLADRILNINQLNVGEILELVANFQTLERLFTAQFAGNLEQIVRDNLKKAAIYFFSYDLLDKGAWYASIEVAHLLAASEQWDYSYDRDWKSARKLSEQASDTMLWINQAEIKLSADENDLIEQHTKKLRKYLVQAGHQGTEGAYRKVNPKDADQIYALSQSLAHLYMLALMSQPVFIPQHFIPIYQMFHGIGINSSILLSPYAFNDIIADMVNNKSSLATNSHVTLLQQVSRAASGL